MGLGKSKQKKSNRNLNSRSAQNNLNDSSPYSNQMPPFNPDNNSGQNNRPGFNNSNFNPNNNFNNSNFNPNNNFNNSNLNPNNNFNNQSSNFNQNNVPNNSNANNFSGNNSNFNGNQKQNGKNNFDNIENNQPPCNQPIVCVIVVDSLNGREISEFIPNNRKPKSKPFIEELDEDDVKILKAIKNKKSSSSDCYTRTTVFNELICE